MSAITKKNKSRSKTSNDFMGKRVIPPPFPSPVVAQPWNSITLMIKAPKTSTYVLNIKNLRSALKAQAGFNTSPDTASASDIHFEVRLQSFNVWTDASRMVVFPLDAMNYSDSRPVELARIDCFAGKNVFARAGYEYPMSLRSVPLSTRYDQTKALLNVQPDNGILEIHFHILWKGSDTGIARESFTYVPAALDGGPLSNSFESLDIVPEQKSVSLDIINRLSRLENLLRATGLDELPNQEGE